MTADKIRDLMEEINTDAMNMDGFEPAIIGIVERFGTPSIFLYDWQKCIDILVDGGCESAEEAEEYLEFNCLGVWVGDGTPAFTNRYGEMSQ